jgi:hypothetical protein
LFVEKYNMQLPLVPAINNFEYVVAKIILQPHKSYSSNFDYTDGLEQQEVINDKQIEVNNNRSINNGKNDGENGDSIGNSNKTAIVIEYTYFWESGDLETIQRSAI